MDIVYYTRPSFLDPAFSKIEALSQILNVHLFIELSPEGWRSAIFDISNQELASGVHDGVSFLERVFPSSLHKYWKRCASVSLVVHTCSKSIHPKTWRVSYQAMKYIKKLNPDVFHLDDISLRLAPLLFTLKGVPFVLNIHDAKAHSGEHNWRTEIARWLTIRKVQQFILHSNFSRNQFLQHYDVPESRVTMIPLGIYDIYREWLTSEIPEEPNTVLFFGRISPYKGVEVFVKAAELVSTSIPNVRFIIAGKAIQGYSLPNLPQLKNGSVFEIYPEYLSNTQVATLISRSSLVVCPYLDASQSGVILTAYAFNKPVIATDVGGLPEYVWEGKTGRIIQPNDPTALADAIVNMLSKKTAENSSPAVYDMLRKNELSWDNSAEETRRIYEKVIQSHN